MAAARKTSTLLHDGGIDRIQRIFPGDGEVSVERPLWDSIAQEPARLSGTQVKLYSVRRAKNHHPLYREPGAGSKDWEFQGPWEVWGTVEFDQAQDIDADAGSEGLKKTANVILWVARKEFEDVSSPDPKIDDVIEFWGSKSFKRAGGFQFFDVVLATPAGNIMTSETFVQWKITLKARSSFDAERKVTNTKI